MPRFGDSDVEPLAYRANAQGQSRSKAAEAKRQLVTTWGNPPVDHHIEELLAALSDLSLRQGEAGDAIP